MKRFMAMVLAFALMLCSFAFAEDAVTFEFDTSEETTEQTTEETDEYEYDLTLIAVSEIELGADDAIKTNVSAAASSVYDLTLSNGDKFSFNAVVGPRKEEYGYVKATNGRGVEVVGGGVAIVASGLWLAVKDIDCVSVVEKSTYGEKYNQTYVESSSDAILVDWQNGHDFSFRYDGEKTLTVYTYISGTVLRTEIYEG